MILLTVQPALNPHFRTRARRRDRSVTVLSIGIVVGNDAFAVQVLSPRPVLGEHLQRRKIMSR